MGHSVPAPPAAPLPDRRGWVIAFGVIEILLGLGCLLLAVFIALFFLKEGSVEQMPGRSPIVGMVVGGGFYLLISAFFFAGGIGSVRCKNWARILMMIGSGVWLAFGVLGVVAVSILVPKVLEMRASAPPGAEHLVVALAIGMEAFFGVLLPLVFLIFYTRKSVQATFLAQGAAPVEASEASQPPPQ